MNLDTLIALKDVIAIFYINEIDLSKSDLYEAVKAAIEFERNYCCRNDLIESLYDIKKMRNVIAHSSNTMSTEEELKHLLLINEYLAKLLNINKDDVFITIATKLKLEIENDISRKCAILVNPADIFNGNIEIIAEIIKRIGQTWSLVTILKENLGSGKPIEKSLNSYFNENEYKTIVLHDLKKLIVEPDNFDSFEVLSGGLQGLEEIFFNILDIFDLINYRNNTFLDEHKAVRFKISRDMLMTKTIKQINEILKEYSKKDSELTNLFSEQVIKRMVSNNVYSIEIFTDIFNPISSATHPLIFELLSKIFKIIEHQDYNPTTAST